MARFHRVILAVCAAVVVLAAAVSALDIDFSPDFPELGHARGDELNRKFNLIKSAFLLNFPTASEPVRYNFTVAAAAATFTWDAASFTYDTTDGRLHVFVEGIYQIPDVDFTQISSVSIAFDESLLAGWKVMLWRW
jgi:hypothetical protein